MAARKNLITTKRINNTEKRTSIGKSKNSKPKNKHKRRGWKKYRGQGR